MTKKKKAAMWAGGIALLLLIACTVASYLIYRALMPHVTTYPVRLLSGENGEAQMWAAGECFYPGQLDETRGMVYRVKQQMGPFGLEYYVEAVAVSIQGENKDLVQLEGDDLTANDKLVRIATAPFVDGDTVVWENGH